MRVWGGEMVEKVLTSGQHNVADPEVLGQSFRRELDHAAGRARCVADFGRVVDISLIANNPRLLSRTQNCWVFEGCEHPLWS